MAEKILMTALSPTMEEGTIVSWNKKEGDKVSSGDLLCEVETDKATMDYESTQEGTLLKIIKGDGSSSKVGDAIGILGEEGEDIADLIKEAESAAADGGAPAEEKSDAPTPAAPAATGAASSAAPAPSAASAGPAVSSDGQVKSSPLARKIAAERGINIGQVPGTGPGGRVVKADVENFKGSTSASGAAAAASSGFAAAAVMQPGQDTTIPVAGIRGVIARRTTESKQTVPHYYLKNSVRMEATMAARKALNAEAPEKVGFNAFLMKFAAEALKRHPEVNASWQGDHIIQFGSIDIGLAVDLGNGLITPIVRNCGNKGVVQIDAELKELIRKAGENKLTPDEYTGASFTISNLGSFGIEEFMAIINQPAASILAVGSIEKTVVVNDEDEIDIAQIMKLTLSCDHRVIDGAAGGRFLYELKRLMENPVRALY
jgi:pyruvate dehydrogenase E2 component (dihydrolipoamide acetyltransferase)